MQHVEAVPEEAQVPPGCAGLLAAGARTEVEDCLASMELSAAEQPSPQPPHLGDHCIHDGDFVVLKREDVFKAVQVQRRK